MKWIAYTLVCLVAIIALAGLAGCSTTEIAQKVEDVSQGVREFSEEMEAYARRLGFKDAAEEHAATEAEVKEAPQDAVAQEDNDVDLETVRSGDQTFLWKPISETRIKACVILWPAKIRESDIVEKRINGVAVTEANGGLYDNRHGYANGNRKHDFLAHPGAYYGAPVTVELDLTDGTTKTWTVPNGAKRYEVDKY